MNQFSYTDLKLARMSIAQGQNIWTGKKAIMCQILSSNHALLQNMIKTGILHFFKHWSWTCTNYCVSKSWHTLRSYAIFVWYKTINVSPKERN